MAKNRYADYTPQQLRDKIKQLEKKRYGLVWENKPEEVAERCDRELPVLVHQPDKEIAKDPAGPTNLLIEGDNYHALFALKRVFQLYRPANHSVFCCPVVADN